MTTLALTSGDTLVVTNRVADATDPGAGEVVHVLLGGVLTLESLTPGEAGEWADDVPATLDYPAEGLTLPLTPTEQDQLAEAVREAAAMAAWTQGSG